MNAMTKALGRMNFKKWCSVGVMLFLTSAVSSCYEDKSGAESGVSIANGDPVLEGDRVARSSVALVRPSPWGSGDYLPYCSGTLIERDLIVTAAHCVSDVSLGSVDVQMIDLTSSAQDQFGPVSVVIEGKPRPHELFGLPTTPDFSYDVAIVRLSRPAPAFMEPVAIASEDEVQLGRAVTLAGYGRIVQKGSRTPIFNPGVLYKVQTEIADLYPIVESNWREDNSLQGLIKFKSPDGRSGGCQGDSGGPMFIDKGAQLLLIGSTVGGPGICAPEGYYTNLTIFKDWIERAKSEI